MKINGLINIGKVIIIKLCMINKLAVFLLAYNPLAQQGLRTAENVGAWSAGEVVTDFFGNMS